MNLRPSATHSTAFRWLGAFTGFYRPSLAEIHSLDTVSRFLYAARSVILVISAQAAVIAGLLAAHDRQFNWLYFFLVLVGFVAAHLLSNLSNDYFGSKRGHDTPDSPRMRYTVHPMASGILAPKVLGAGFTIIAAIGVAVAAYFVAVHGYLAVGFLIPGVVLLFAYDAAPIPLKSIGLGEAAVFFAWGPLMVGGGYAMIAGHVSAGAFYASLPYGLGVMSILVGKHIDQIEFDRGKKIQTLPVLIGEHQARLLEMCTLVVMYAVVGILVALGIIAPFCLLVALALPRGFRAVAAFARPRPEFPPEGYVGWPLWYHRACLLHNREFGWLYILGLAAGAAFPHVQF